MLFKCRRMAPFIHDDDQQYFLPTRHEGGDKTTTTTTTTAGNGAKQHQAARDMPPPKTGTLTAAATAAGEVDRAEDISVALEWKLLLPLLARGAEDPMPSDRRSILEVSPCAADDNDEHVQACAEQAYSSVAQTILQTGERAVTLPALLRDGAEEKDFWSSSWVVKKANSAEPLDAERSLRGYVWVPVEICSPKMRLSHPVTRARMQTVLDALNAAHRLTANCTCEVHVHLGRMDGRPWALATLQRLGSLLWVAEPTLRSIRDPKSPNYSNVYTWGFAMRQHSRLARRVGELVSPGLPAPPELAAHAEIPDEKVHAALQDLVATAPRRDEEVTALAEIWQASSHLELGQLLSGPSKKYRRLGFNFSAFGEEDERARRNPRTMEFRMMDGSARTDLVLGWLAICGRIAEAAVSRRDGAFADALRTALRQAEDNETGTGMNAREALSDRRGREFRELMLALGVAEQHYSGWEEKIRREHC